MPNEENPKRRASDKVADGNSLPEVILQMLVKIETDIAELRSDTSNGFRDVHKAFLRDEDNLPDFEGHRLAHKASKQHSERMEMYKQDVVKKIMGGAAMTLLGIVVMGILAYAKQQLLGG